MGSTRIFLLIAAAAVAAPSIAAAQDTGTRIVVIGAMQDTGTRIVVIGASKDRADARRGEDPADRNLPALPVVYDDDTPANAPARTPAAAAPAGR